MAQYSLLSELKMGPKSWSVLVRVSRMWDYRGGTDDGPIARVDLVLLDGQVTPSARLMHFLYSGLSFDYVFLCTG